MSPLDRVRCEGSITVPVETAESRGRPTGKCAVCTGWQLLLKSGLLKDHRVSAPFDSSKGRAA